MNRPNRSRRHHGAIGWRSFVALGEEATEQMSWRCLNVAENVIPAEAEIHAER